MATFVDILISLYTREALICHFFKTINTLNIAGKDIVLNSQDAQSFIDLKTDNAF